MRQKIQQKLHQIETDENVAILYACESGSRAWGFESTDSDYDIRFIYSHPKDWYLSIDVERKRDVIEREIDEDLLDVSGWDIRKALNLFRKSNPPLLEWLNSPIVYQKKTSFFESLKNLLPQFYSPIACRYHYLHMAQGNYREYLKGDVVWIKKYFYVMRPLLAIKWIEAKSTPVPMEFQILVDEMLADSPAVKQEVQQLIQMKKEGKELDRGAKIPILSDYLKNELAHQETKTFPHKKSRKDIEKLNQLFRDTLNEAWNHA